MHAIYIHFKIHWKSNKSVCVLAQSRKPWQQTLKDYLHVVSAQVCTSTASLPSNKWTVQVLSNISASPCLSALVQRLFIQSFFHGHLRTWLFYTLPVYLRQWGYMQAYKVIYTHGNLQLWAFGELNMSLCVFAEHHLNTWHYRCRKPHFLTWLNLLAVKPSGKNTWYKPYDLTLHDNKTKKNTLYKLIKEWIKTQTSAVVTKAGSSAFTNF